MDSFAGKRGSIARPRISGVIVRNCSNVIQCYGKWRFGPGEFKEVPRDVADELLKQSSFDAGAIPNTPTLTEGFVAEVRHAFWPDEERPTDVSEFTASVFPCKTDEFDPILPADESISICFRMNDLVELHGGARVVGRLCHHLASRGHRVSVSPAHTSVRPPDFKGIPIEIVPSVPPGVDVVVGTYWPTITEIHGYSSSALKVGLIQGDEPAWPTNPPADAIMAEDAFSHDGVLYIAVCEELAIKCAEKYGTPDVRALPGNGVDPLDFSPRQFDTGVRDAVFSICRDVWWKGTDTMLEMVEYMKSKRPSLRAIGAGFGPFRHPLIDHYAQSPSVEEMAQLYSMADFYISASLFEGSPMTPLEAMACGCIPVVTDIGVPYLDDHPSAGILLDPSDWMAAADQMLGVMDNDIIRRSMRSESLAVAAGKTWRSVGEAFEGMLMEGLA